MLNSSNDMFMKFKKKLFEKKTVLGIALQSTDTPFAEIVALTGFDFAWIETEHTTATLKDVEHLIIVLENYGCIPLVRVRNNNSNSIGQVLDMGARIVNIPHIDSVRDAQQAVQAAKYYPLGRRGFSMCSRSTGQGILHLNTTLMQKKNNENMLMVQIESEEAVRNVEDIAMINGVDILFVGYADLCQDMGISVDLQHPQCEKAIQKVSKALNQSGKIGALFISDPQKTTYYRKLGFTMICCGMDTIIFKNAAEDILKKFRSAEST